MEHALRRHLDQKNILERSHVNQLLKKAVEKPVVSVVAGAGCGKTQAVSAFLRQSGIRTVWIQLSQLDNYPARFWEMLVDTVGRIDRDFSVQMREMGFPDSLEATNRFLHMLAASCYRAKKVVVAFDNLHLISAPSIQGFIENLLSSHIETLCAILISRTTPEFPHFNMYANDRIAQVTKDDLCFTPREVKEYLEMAGMKPGADYLKKVYEVTEGWPVAVHLTGLCAGKPCKDPLEYSLPLLFDLVEHEMFSRYSAGARHAIVKLSLLEDFPAELVKIAAGSHFAEVMELLDTNMFVTFNPFNGRYTLQYFFMCFLREKQLSLKTEDADRFYAQAAAWYQSQNAVVEAATYFERCREYDALSEIMRHHNQYDDPGGKAVLFLDMLERFPAGYLKNHKLIRILKAHFYIQVSDIDKAWRDFVELEEELEKSPSPENNTLLGEVCIGLGMASIIRQSWDFEKYFLRAGKLLERGSALITEKQMFVGAHNALFLFSSKKGEMRKTIKALFEVMPAASRAMNGCAYGFEHLAATEAHYYKREFEAAAQYAWRAIERAKQKEQHDIAAQGYMLLMRIEFARGDYPETEAMWQTLREYIQAHPSAMCNNILDIAEGWLYTRIGHYEKVAAWILDDTLNGKINAPISMGRERLIKAEYFLELKKYFELLGLLEEAAEFSKWRGFWFLLLKTHLLAAICQHRTGNVERAAQKLKEAYEMAHGNGIVMPFIEQGRHMRSLIQAVKNMGGHGLPEAWLNDIQKKASTFAKRQLYMVNEYAKRHKKAEAGGNLSAREREVLFALCQALTREEIADSCGISVNTVKSVLRSIYNKLGAVNRSDAIRIAVDSGLMGDKKDA